MSLSETASLKKTRKHLRWGALIAAVVIVLVIAEGLVTRASGNANLKSWTEAQAVPTVAVIAPIGGGNQSGLDLPGRLEAYQRAPIYARVSGYVKEYKVDIGTPVKAGQLLAEIETPDVDQQLLQARADLNTAQANASLAKTTSDRWQTIVKTGAVAKQDADEKLGDYQAKQTMVSAAKANVDRLLAMKNFSHITAPFDGQITARNTDVGALINVGSSAGQELFVVSDTHKLRVYVNVPQNYVPNVRPGTKATIKVPEHPEKNYTATVESSSQAVTAASGTALMQLGVDNANSELLPGSYAAVHLDMPSAEGVLTIPASAIIFDAKGLAVATVGADNRVTVKTISLGRDLGKTIEVKSGLGADDKVIDSPPDGIATGTEVRIAGVTKPSGPGDKAQEQKK
ncbi:MAG: efflux RND transporter periplasmic adaptor subunit [Rudaea sp.]